MHLFPFKFTLLFSFFFLAKNNVYTQLAVDSQDTTLAIRYYDLANESYKTADTCLKYSKLALPLLEKTQLWNKYIYTLCGLNHCYQSLGQYDLQEKNNFFAYEKAKELLPKENIMRQVALNNVGIVYSDIRENHLEALRLYKMVNKNLSAESDEKFPFRAATLENIGDTYYKLGDFPAAISYFQQSVEHWSAVRIAGKTKIPYIRLAKAYDKFANVHEALQQNQQAKALRLKAVAALALEDKYDQIFDVKNQLGIAKNNLALGLTDTVLVQLKQLQQIDSLPPLQQTNIYLLLGKTYLKQRQPQLAIVALQNAIKTAAGLEQVGKKARSHHELGQVYFTIKQYNKALDHQQAALRLLFPNDDLTDNLTTPQSAHSTSARLEVIELLHAKIETLAQLFLQTNNIKYLESELATHQLWSKMTAHLRTYYQSTAGQLLLLSEAKDSYETAIDAAIRLFELKGDSTYLEQAFFFAEQSKSNLLLDEIRKKATAGQLGVSEQRLKREYSLQATINFYKKKLRDSLAQSNVASTSISTIRETLFETKEELTQLSDSIKQLSPNYVQLIQQQPKDIPAIQKLLRPNQQMIKYFVGQKRTYQFSISQNHYTYHVAPDSEAIEQLTAQLFTQTKMKGTNGMEQYQQTAFTLYQQLFPVPLSPTIQEVVIIPDGQLENLPFGTLVTQKEHQKQTLKDVPYLIKNHAISYAYSATIWAEQAQQSNENELELLRVFPIFKDQDKELFFSQEEYKKLEFIEGVALMERDATLTKLRYYLNKKPNRQILHFSTHARGKDATANEPSIDLFDTTMLLSQLEYQQLDIPLVVLSACETNVGRYQKGEGIMNLSRGFTYAGVPSIITSVANVSEQSTSIIMGNLYANLAKGMPKHQALRQAKLDYLNSTNVDPTALTPYHWGSFLLIGNVDKVRLKVRKGWTVWVLGGVFGGIMLLILGIWKMLQQR